MLCTLRVGRVVTVLASLLPASMLAQQPSAPPFHVEEATIGFVSHKDAFQVRRIKEAGALVLAKSNMAEWAFTPYETVSSILPGYTRNPYALDRVTAGSSGGTAAAVAASMGTVGLGSDTGNSIRGPRRTRASWASGRRWD